MYRNEYRPKTHERLWKKRIQEKGGEVSEKIFGAPRIFRKNEEVPGLDVSRSIEDIVAHEVGVSCEPDVFEKELDSDDHFIVIGSEGIWDAMNSFEVVGFVFQKMENDKDNCSKLLAEGAGIDEKLKMLNIIILI